MENWAALQIVPTELFLPLDAQDMLEDLVERNILEKNKFLIVVIIFCAFIFILMKISEEKIKSI